MNLFNLFATNYGLLILPLVGATLCALNLKAAPRIATLLIGMNILVALFNKNLGKLEYIVTLHVLFISFIIHHFSTKYMAGDKNYNNFFAKLSSLTSSIVLFVISDDIRFLALGLLFSNYFLCSLMLHKPEWKQADNSSKLAFRTLISGTICFILALTILHLETESYSLTTILDYTNIINSNIILTVISLLFLTVICQSGLIPMHKWLISSINAPTPVSAMMHAGLVNSSGLIMAKFATFYLSYPRLMTLIFIIGAASAFIGTASMLVQSNIKHKLGCSTVGQMGFMIMQCGLGLFPAAISHLCMHGFFKATMFLSAGSALKETMTHYVISENEQLTFFNLIKSILIGILGGFIFSKIVGINIMELNTNLVQLGFITLLFIQLSLLLDTTMALILVSFFAGLYGFIVQSFDQLLFTLYQPQPLNLVHIVTFGIFTLLWGISIKKPTTPLLSKSNHIKLYKMLLNVSAPATKTITISSTNYKY